MNRVIITGATSMLGIATIKECIKNNIKVTALFRAGSSRRDRLPQSSLLTLLECDLSGLKDIELPDDEYDMLFHFGWGYTDKSTRDDPILQSRNITYTLDAVQLAKRCGCKKFLGAGSQAEYGFRKCTISEDTPVKPGTSYGYSKYAAGKLAEKLCGQLGIVCIWTRIFSVYGCNDSENTMISYALTQHGKGETAHFSSGTQMWDFLYEEDAGRYFYLLGEQVLESTVVNVASGDVRPLKEYIMEMAEVLGQQGGSFRYELAAPAGQEQSYNGIDPDVSLLRKLTGYLPKTNFSKGIQTVAGILR